MEMFVVAAWLVGVVVGLARVVGAVALAAWVFCGVASRVIRAIKKEDSI